ncbi:MAG: YbaN family protein [Lachnospiraceae bacterium]|nr:YbaN family protein [Lachnospiraceae bacterium]
MPLLPTTPLVLLAAICFSAANEKLNNWLSRSRLFGPYIENYRTGQGISKCRKIVSVVYLWIGLVTSMIVIQTTAIYIILSIVGIGVTIHILMIKTKKK